MNREELLLRLNKGYEWRDLEVKEGLWKLPASIWDSVSAFANTDGGWIVLGVEEKQGQFEIVGVIDVDKVHSAFRTGVREKLSAKLDPHEDLIDVDGKKVLAFFIAEAPRKLKPVFTDNINNSRVRRGGRDEKCTDEQIRRMLRDASDSRYEDEVASVDPNDWLDVESLIWYRKLFHERHPGSKSQASHKEFLHEELAVLKDEGKGLQPTNAAVLLFGSEAAIRQVLPRLVLDMKWLDYTKDEYSAQNWSDRRELQCNLIQAWGTIVERYKAHSQTPFTISADSFRRSDDPPDYIAFREASINVLMHQDYGDKQRNGLITFFRDCTDFWNPGDAFAHRQELMQNGEKEVRNPRIATAFRRVGLSERAGSGIPRVFSEWSALGKIPPAMNNNKVAKCFQLSLPTQMLITEELRLQQAGLGVPLSEDQARVFALAIRTTAHINLVDVQTVTRRTKSKATEIVATLVVQGILSQVGDYPEPAYGLSERVRDRIQKSKPSGASATVAYDSGTSALLSSLTSVQRDLLSLCDSPRRLSEIRAQLGYGRLSLVLFRQALLQPLIDGGLLQIRNPGSVRTETFVLTPAGVAWKADRVHNQMKQ